MTNIFYILVSCLVSLGLSYLLFVEIDRQSNPQLQCIMRINDRVDNINCGGCGYFAMRLYERLLDKDYRIIEMKAGDARHYAIQDLSNGMFIDADGYRDTLSYQLRGYTKFESISYDSLKTLVYKFEIWNPAFRRSDTTLIKQFIDAL